MARRRLPDDFKEFLKLLTAHDVRYLLVGGHAVGAHGYPRNTQDIAVWIASNPSNAQRIVAALREFGFDLPTLSPEPFLTPHKIVRMGHKPLLIEIHTTLAGVEFRCMFRSEGSHADR